nr:MAG TPA: hypothetical protein [Caudoviricetes sp.]
MATSVQDIYKRFLAQIGKDVIAELEQELAEELMLIYLEGAISMFDICEKDLTIEDYSFKEDLTLNEQYILADGMILYWLKPKINTEKMIDLIITTSDYNIKSPANLLDKLNTLYNDSFYKFRNRINRYSFKGKKVNG